MPTQGGGVGRRNAVWAWVVGAVLAAGAGAGCAGEEQLERVHGRIEVSARRLDFGALTLGESRRQGLLIWDRGRVASSVVRWEVVPGDTGFALVSRPDELSQRAAREAVLAFHPRQAGQVEAVLHLETDDGGSLEVALSGRGVDARIEGPERLRFGRPAVGATRWRTVTFANPAETSVAGSLTFVGADAAEFSGAGALELGPFETRAVRLAFAPRGRAGQRSALLRLVACPLCVPRDLPVDAEAVAAPLVADPSPLGFGPVRVDGENRRRVTLTNATDEHLRVEPPVVAGPDRDGFAIEAWTQAEPLAPLESLRVWVTFTPMRLGAAGASLLFSSDAEPSGELAVPMMAESGGSQLVVAPERLAFRRTPVQGRSELEVVVSNGGAAAASPPLTLTGFGITAGSDFSIVDGPGAGASLPVGAKQTVRIAFSPTAAGRHDAILSIRSDDPTAPEVLVTLTGDAFEDNGCLLEVQPPAIDFGAVPPGRSALLGARITNVGTAPCSLWDGAISGDPAFSLARPRNFVRLAPGAAVFAPITYAPTVGGMHRALFSFQTSRNAAQQLEIPISGGSRASCLVAEPPFLGFGAVRVDCGARRLSTTLRNSCAAPIEVTSLLLGAGADPAAFVLEAADSTPVSIASGAAVGATVRYDPEVPGYATAPLFAGASDLPWPKLVPVSGEALAAGDHDERFVQPSPGKLDLLWVVDNTASMDDERPTLLRNALWMLGELGRRGADHHVAVTTSGIGVPPPGLSSVVCPGGAKGGEDGRLFPVDGSRERIVTRATPHPEGVLAGNLAVGGCHSVEQPLEAARLALTPPLANLADDPSTPAPNDGNLGFRRSDAPLVVLVATDEDDSSPYTVDETVRRLRAASNGSPVILAAIVAPQGGCPSAVSEAPRCLLAARALGGPHVDLCSDDWHAPLNALLDDVLAPKRRYALEAGAEPSSIVVTIDGAEINTYDYDQASASVVFRQPPPPGAEVRIRYVEPCSP